MLVSCQANPHTSTDTAKDPALMTIHYVGAGHPRAIPPGLRRVPVPLCHHQQIHKVAEKDPCGQDQQKISSQVHQVYRL
jgi:hypothetical protein